jgi:uncharacterized membrane protein
MAAIINMTSDFLEVLLLATLPFTELRLALPLALTVYNLPPASAYIAAVIGNILPVIVIIKILPWFVSTFREKISLLDKFFTWWFNRVNSTYESKMKKWGTLALLIFVAIPLPMTGAWTGSVAAYLFNIPQKKAFIYILLGVMIAGIVILSGTLGIIKLF